MPRSDFTQLQITEAQAETYALRHFGMKAKARTLPGEVDFNFLLDSENGEKFTLKISRPGVDLAELDFQEQMMAHLQQKNMLVQTPNIHRSPAGDSRICMEDGFGNERWLRLQTWLEGRMMAKVNPHTPQLLESLGKTCGYLSKSLIDFDHPFAQRVYAWDPAHTLTARQYREYIQGEENQAIADYFWELFEQISPKLASLRQSVNHNDLHDYNVLVSENRLHPTVCGVIDFGDAVFTHTINELAIACAYACMNKVDPLEAAKQVVRGYHVIFPLEEAEVEVLFSLIAARLIISVAHSAYNKHREPDNEYLLVSEQPAWKLLKQLKEISPAFAHYSFRHACGWEPVPMRKIFDRWTAENPDAGVAPISLEGQRIANPDLSIGSLQLGNHANFETIKAFRKTISRLLEDQDANIGIGGYGEVRPVYAGDAYVIEGNNGPQWRTLHLGLDIWAPTGTPVRAAYAGRVHSFADNMGDRNYGPTIILEHRVAEELTFYSLYGHLRRTDLNDLQVGMQVEAGQQIGSLGEPSENGNWPPHVHVQLMLDLMEWEGDFPGVALADEAEVWLSLCPPLSNIPNLEAGGVRMTSADRILDTRSQKLGKSLSISYDKPLHMVRGYRQYLFDTTGRRYLDTVNNVAHVGHEHPRVVRSAQRQMAVLNTNTRYLHENITRFAEELLATFPPELCVCHFVNSGSEANELALRMAQTWSNQRDMIAVEVGYHGNTGACIDVSSYKFDGQGGQGAPEHVHVVPIPDTYRGLYRNDPQAGENYAAHIQQSIEQVKAKGKGIAGFICESILSCGGQIVLPEGYLKEAYGYVHAAGGLCIADEVQVGFGRVGEAFWGFELQGVVPDIVTMGKPIGNGHPLAAVVTTRAVADAFANGMEYFNTFGGNPVSCAVGREVLQIIRDEDLQAHARETGNYLADQLRELQAHSPIIGDVRGPGLFQGFELVKDRESLLPAATEATYLANRMCEHGILMSTDGPYHNVLKIKPPMCFDRANVDFLIDRLNLILQEDLMKV